MESAMNEKKNDWSDKAMSHVKNLDPEEIRRAATKFGTRVRDVSSEAYDDTVGYIRRNPVGSALGLCAFGFFAGLLTGMVKRSA